MWKEIEIIRKLKFLVSIVVFDMIKLLTILQVNAGKTTIKK